MEVLDVWVFLVCECYSKKVGFRFLNYRFYERKVVR